MTIELFVNYAKIKVTKMTELQNIKERADAADYAAAYTDTAYAYAHYVAAADAAAAYDADYAVAAQKSQTKND